MKTSSVGLRVESREKLVMSCLDALLERPLPSELKNPAELLGYAAL